MRFGHHRQSSIKRLFVRPPAQRNSEINVTPLVDVVLVLLIIFMVVTPLLEKNIPVNTPSSEKVEEVTEVPPDQLVVYVNRTGQMRINSDAVTDAVTDVGPDLALTDLPMTIATLPLAHADLDRLDGPDDQVARPGPPRAAIWTVVAALLV